MAIQSASEFEAVMSQVIVRVEKAIVEQGSLPIFETMIRELQAIKKVARQPSQLKPMRQALEKLTETLTEKIPDDAATLERLWDLADYIDYWA